MRKASVTRSKGAGRILWAVDPFGCEESILRAAAKTIRALAQAGEYEIQPLYVWQDTPLFAPVQEGQTTQAKVRDSGQKRLDDALSLARLPGASPLEVVPIGSTSIREAVHELLCQARKREADLIVVSTHARKGLDRFLLGSFAETLLLRSNIPILIVHPNVRRVPDFRTILFPTDFSDESMTAFRSVLEFAAFRGSRVILFHKPEVPAPVVPELVTFAFTPHYRKEYEIEVRRFQQAADELVRRGKAAGVKVKVMFDRSKNPSASDAIVRHARRLNSAVAMASRSGLIGSTLLGSTTRQVVRYCEQPVWVIHPAARPARGEEPLFRVTEQEIDEDLLEHRRRRRA